MTNSPEINKRQISAADSIWRAAADLPSVPASCFLLTDAEYQNINISDGICADILTLEEINDMSALPPKYARPYISDEAWEIFFSLRGFLLRLHILARTEIQKKKGSRKTWKEDNLIKQHLLSVMDENQYLKWAGTPIHGLWAIVYRLETMLLEELREKLGIKTEPVSMSDNDIIDWTKRRFPIHS